MAPSRAQLSGPVILPTTAPLPSSYRLPPADPKVLKTLSALSRAALLDLASQWCSDENSATCGPYVDRENTAGDDGFDEIGGNGAAATTAADDTGDNPWTAATSIEELRQLYTHELTTRRGTKRELLDRILEGDWRHGVSLEQLAMAEVRGALDNSSARRWVAAEIYSKSLTPASADTDATLSHSPASAPSSRQALPKLNPKTFTRALHSHMAALAKAHYHIAMPSSHPLIVVRIALYDSPYSTSAGSFSLTSPKSVLLAFPHYAPSYIYISVPSAGASVVSASDLDDTQSTAGANATSTIPTSVVSFLIRSVGPALSRPGFHFALRPTNLEARSLDTLLALRGASDAGAGGIAGGWSVFADGEFGTERGAALLGSEAKMGRAGKKLSSVERVVEAVKKKKRALALRGKTLDGRDAATAGGDAEFSGSDEGANSKMGAVNPNVPFQHANPKASISTGKRKKLAHEAAARFGVANPAMSIDSNRAPPNVTNTTALQRFDVEIQEPLFPSASTDNDEDDGEAGSSSVRFSFTGRDVFAGIRALAEIGVIDARRMPGWLTGEAGVSTAVVKDGRLQQEWEGGL